MIYRTKNTNDNALITFTVRFQASGDVVTLDSDYFTSVVHLLDAALLPWARLDHKQCPHCPLCVADTYHCPAALSIASLVRDFADHHSHEQVTVTVVDRVGRRTEWPVDLQKALAVLIRVALFASGCPVVAQFAPAIAGLRPLATPQELLKHILLRFLLVSKGERSDAEQEIRETMKALHTVAKSLCGRFRSELTGDAVVNAVVVIDAIASALEYDFDGVYGTIMQEINAIGEEFPPEHDRSA